MSPIAWHKSEILVAGLCALTAFAVYCLTLPPTITGEDSGELIAAAYCLGIPHPPGYPLWTVLAHGFTWLPVYSVAWRVALMSAVFAAAAVYVIALWAMRITGDWRWAGAGALAAAFSSEFWKHAVIAEVYTLNAFLFILCLYLLFRWHETRRDKYLYACAVCFGLGMTNHQTMILLAPVIALTVLLDERGAIVRRCLICAVLGALPLAIYAYLPLRSAADPYMDWGNPETWENFWAVITREQLRHQMYAQPRTLALFFQQLSAAVNLYVWEFTAWMAWLPLIGLLALWQKNRAVFWLAGATAAFVMGAFILITNFEVSWRGLWITNFYFIPAYLLCGVAIAPGLQWLAERLKHSAFSPQWAALLAVAVALSPLLWHFRANDKSGYYFADDYGRNLLQGLAENAIIFPGSDHATFPLLYLQSVEGLRPDVTLGNKYGYHEVSLVPLGMVDASRRYPTPDEQRAIERMSIGLTSRPVYFTTPRTFPELPSVRVVPEGLAYRALRLEDTPRADDPWAVQHWYTLDPADSRGDLSASFILADYYLRRADDYFAAKNLNEGKTALENVLKVGGKEEEVVNNTGLVLAKYGFLEAAIEQFQRAANMDPRFAAVRINLARALFHAGRAQDARAAVLDALTLEPENPVALALLREIDNKGNPP